MHYGVTQVLKQTASKLQGMHEYWHRDNECTETMNAVQMASYQLMIKVSEEGNVLLLVS